MKNTIKKNTKRIIKIISILLFTLLIVLFFLSIYIKYKFNNTSFDQILYTFVFSRGSNSDVIKDGVLFVLPRTLFAVGLIILIQIFIKKKIIDYPKKVVCSLKIKDKEFNYQLFRFNLFKKIVLFLLIVIVPILLILNNIRFFEYLQNRFNTTNIYDKYYVPTRNVFVAFENEKRNLIYIVLESEETTNLSKNNGGGVNTSYTPNLEKLALNNTNFSNTDKLGGAYQINGITWTAASLVAQTSGLPINSSVLLGYYFDATMPGIYSIGEILEDNGYKNYFILGSDANFGDRRTYFEKHGNYKIMDYLYAKDNGWIDEDYSVWWGYEDKKLFEFAKKELLEISKNDEPFNFTILTVDTHFYDGYYDETCENDPFSEQYHNVFHCNDKMINEFITWVQNQSFYKNTTIVIVGDHLAMQDGVYSDLNSDFERTVYSVIINSAIKNPKNTKNRKYSLLDMMPTTLVALGASIEGDKLALGTNLYSNEKTLVEELGIDYLNQELVKYSKYYAEILFK